MASRGEFLAETQPARPFSYFLIFIFSHFLFSCSSPTPPKPEEEALAAAVRYYGWLTTADSLPRFMHATAGYDTLPAGYQQQLVLSMQMYREQHPIAHVAPARATLDTTTPDTTATAMLALVFADSTREEVAVPMVLQHGTWLMK